MAKKLHTVDAYGAAEQAIFATLRLQFQERFLGCAIQKTWGIQSGGPDGDEDEKSSGMFYGSVPERFGGFRCQ
jgi:hypothetical protein